MKAMMLAFASMAVISVAASYGLKEYAGFSSERQTSGDSVRLD